MVDLEPLSVEDEDLVRSLIDEHVAHTRSARGKAVLANFAKRHFVKVMPHEWRRVLELRKTGT
jgi:glutamate synthase (NADPH/NADH) large chain